VGDKLRDRYREMAGEEGPSEEQVREALKTLGNAVQSVFESIGAAMKDPEVRTQVKDAAAGFVSAMGETFKDLGEEIQRTPEPAVAETAPSEPAAGSPSADQDRPEY
jgi:enamine deaminase RidA (YjgF/YER057c/UK114 family)